MVNKALESMIGRRFSRLEVIGEAEPFTRKDGRKESAVLCKCQCGAEVRARTRKVRSGHKQSCGCLQRERTLKHGMSRSLTYKSWQAMQDRCYRKASKQHYQYGGRGIGVCDQWRGGAKGFKQFLADMGERPGPEYSLDRIDNNAGYEPSNCRWATWTEQQRNKRSNRRVTYQGVRMTVAEAAKLAGINPYLVYKRLDKGWSLEKALSRKDYRSSGGRRALG